MKLRHAGFADAEAVARLELASGRAAPGGRPQEPPGGGGIEGRTGYWRSEILSPTNVIVAEDEGAIVGFVACGPEREEEGETAAAGADEEAGPEDGDPQRSFDVYALHVHPSRQKEGIGAGLFGAACTLGQEAGAAEIAAWVEEADSDARRFASGWV